MTCPVKTDLAVLLKREQAIIKAGVVHHIDQLQTKWTLILISRIADSHNE